MQPPRSPQTLRRPPQPPVPQEQWLTPGRSAPHRSARSGPALPTQPRSRVLTPAPRDQQERPPIHRLPPPWDDSEPLPRKPLGARGRWIVRGLVLAVIVTGLLIALSQGNSAPSAAQPTPGHTTMPSKTQPPRQATPQPTNAPPATPPASSAVSPQDLAAQFLAAYFSWTAGESDQDYLKTWRALVVDASVADLDTASPRLTLDNGTDDAATSPTPIIPASAETSQDGQAQIILTWTIQVLPAGGELTQPESRRIQATLDLIQHTTSWFITNIGWTSF